MYEEEREDLVEAFSPLPFLFLSKIKVREVLTALWVWRPAHRTKAEVRRKAPSGYVTTLYLDLFTGVPKRLSLGPDRFSVRKLN